ncbi:hypothetical protein FQA39_LY09389 [Lamprigera yunnana]|nr:hypothetical protein FQA39_LY09389 [Lamprigera yunnana]
MTKRYQKEDSCWDYRTGLEKILIAATITALVVVITLMVLVILLSRQDITKKDSYVAAPMTYTRKISEIEQRIDTSINPCEDFYKFACGKLLKEANGNQNLGPFYLIQEKAKRQIEELYNDPVHNNDHKVVKVAKNLYKHCMNESSIEKDGLNIIKIVLEKLGGWPVVKGIHWNKSKFSWIHAEYMLRELGYFYSSFLTVNVVDDPKNEQKFIYRIAIPDFDDFGAELFDKQRLMVDVAIAFGADEERALLDIAEVLDFMLNIKREVFLRGNEVSYQRLTLTDVHKRYQFINWIEFVNNIIGSAIKVSTDDFVLIPAIRTLKKWYTFIENVPKRVQANYVIWKVIEKVIPIIPDLEKLQFKDNNRNERSSFCIEQVRKRFTPSPIDLMYVKTHLHHDKRNKIKKIINDMRWELQDLLEKTNWMDLNEKYNVIAKVTNLKIVVGVPDELLDNEILDDMDFDLKASINGTFLETVAEVERSHQSWLYNQMYSSKSEFELTTWKLQTSSAIGDYYFKDNAIILPATIFQDVVYDERRLQYLNYGSMGNMMGQHFLNVLGETTLFDQDGNVIEFPSNISTNLFLRRSECLKQQMGVNIPQFMIELIQQKSLGLQLSYSAIQKKSKNLDVSDLSYTPKQLFWISAASYDCQPSKTVDDRDLFSLLASVPMLNNQNFGTDFNCKSGSKMNPKDKCEVV